jgi:hypothetical protein
VKTKCKRSKWSLRFAWFAIALHSVYIKFEIDAHVNHHLAYNIMGFKLTVSKLLCILDRYASLKRGENHMVMRKSKKVEARRLDLEYFANAQATKNEEERDQVKDCTLNDYEAKIMRVVNEVTPLSTEDRENYSVRLSDSFGLSSSFLGCMSPSDAESVRVNVFCYIIDIIREFSRKPVNVEDMIEVEWTKLPKDKMGNRSAASVEKAKDGRVLLAHSAANEKPARKARKSSAHITAGQKRVHHGDEDEEDDFDDRDTRVPVGGFTTKRAKPTRGGTNTSFVSEDPLPYTCMEPEKRVTMSTKVESMMDKVTARINTVFATPNMAGGVPPPPTPSGDPHGAAYTAAMDRFTKLYAGVVTAEERYKVRKWLSATNNNVLLFNNSPDDELPYALGDIGVEWSYRESEKK